MINHAPLLNIPNRWQLVNLNTGNTITFLYNPSFETNLYDLKRDVVYIDALDIPVFVKDIGDIEVNDIRLELKNYPQEFVDVIETEYKDIDSINTNYRLVTHNLDCFIVKWKNLTIKPVKTAYIKYYIKKDNNFYPNNYYEQHFLSNKADIYDITMEFVKILKVS